MRSASGFAPPRAPHLPTCLLQGKQSKEIRHVHSSFFNSWTRHPREINKRGPEFFAIAISTSSETSLGWQSKFLQRHYYRTNAGERCLDQMCAHDAGEPEPVRAMKCREQGAAQNNDAHDQEDGTFYCHNHFLMFCAIKIHQALLFTNIMHKRQAEGIAKA